MRLLAASRRLLAIAAIAAGMPFADAQAFVPPPVSPKPVAPQGAWVEITNAGNMYDLINTTDCIAWPSPEVRAKGGLNGWGEWRPKNGDRGMATAWTKHCFMKAKVVFVHVPPYWVPMGEDGIRFLTGSLDNLPEITK